jgi:3',5'-cyclic AMP phosphodiesterase CpdA
MRLAWATDVHLNFLTAENRRRFLEQLQALDVDAFLLGGDVAEADSLAASLAEAADVWRRPIYFVLGNHDFYRGSIAEVRDYARQATKDSAHLRWLGATGPVALTAEAALVGHDGWGDARNGDYWGSALSLTDFSLIHEFIGVDRHARQRLLERLGDESAAALAADLEQITDHFERVVVLTHVPPFPEACTTEGRIWRDDWLPFFTSRAVGDVLLSAAQRYTRVQYTVLCGHTHRAGDAVLRENLRVVTGPAEYRAPVVQQLLTLDGERLILHAPS